MEMKSFSKMLSETLSNAFTTVFPKLYILETDFIPIISFLDLVTFPVGVF